MPDNYSLLNQLASRAKLWHVNTGIPQTSMAKAIGMESSNYNAFLQENKGLNAEATCLLLQFIAMPKRQAVARFGKPAPTSKILNLQEREKSRMVLDNDGWVSGQSGVDPNDAIASGIDAVADADTSMDVAATVATL